MCQKTKGRPPAIGFTSANKTEIYEEYNKGVTVPALSEQYKCSVTTIYRFIYEEQKRLATMRFHNNRPKQ